MFQIQKTECKYDKEGMVKSSSVEIYPHVYSGPRKAQDILTLIHAQYYASPTAHSWISDPVKSVVVNASKGYEKTFRKWLKCDKIIYEMVASPIEQTND